MFLRLFVFTLLSNGILSVYSCIICEGNNVNITCPLGQIIIENANYGRHNSTICPRAGLDQNINCSSANATLILQERCNGKENCIVPVTNKIFGDPCVGTYKYLGFNYTCIARSIELCGVNEERISCGPDCNSRFCTPPPVLHISTVISPGIIIGPICRSCCICKQGYLKDIRTGVCVKSQYCPLPGTECETHEVYSQCGARCQPTCSDQKPCCKDAPCVQGYVCAENYVRDCATKRCVKPSDCPKRVTPL